MELKFKVHAKIGKPVEEVFDAVHNPQRLSGYFTTAGASGPLDEGAVVNWEFADHPGAFPVTVTKMIPNHTIVLTWEAAEGGYDTTVEMSFTELDAQSTLVEIAESGWKSSEQGLQDSYGNCMGWSQMLSFLKAYCEHNINLRQGFY